MKINPPYVVPSSNEPTKQTVDKLRKRMAATAYFKRTKTPAIRSTGLARVSTR